MSVLRTAETRRRKESGRSLEARVVGVALVSTLTALLAAFALYQWRNWSADRAELAEESVKLAQAIGVSADRELQSGTAETQAVTAALFYGSEKSVAAAYWDAGGRELRLAKPGHDSARLSAAGVDRPRARYRGSALEVHVPQMVEGRRAGEVALLVDGGELVAERLVNIGIALALSLVATLAAGLLARSLARRALAPLRAVDEAMRAAAASRNFGLRLPVAEDDEIGRLTRRFNRLLGSLEDYDESLKAALREATAARDAAEGANTMKARFLANMGHELRTPLNGVLGMSQALLREPLTPAQRERVGVILSSGSALLTVLNDILDLADMERGEVRLECQPFDLAAVVEQACATASMLAESKGLSLDIEIEPGARGAWMGDPGRLRQLVYTLVSNGLKFTEVGGVSVRLTAGGRGVVLTVADTGIGIPATVLPHLFESFTQADGGATRRVGGMGLGLAICRQVVGLMQGTLAVESACGRGSTFTLMLPLDRASRQMECANPDDGIESLRVLVAEDNETNQRVVRTVLNALGVDPMIVADGRETVEAWSSADWDLILMDIQMPILDGVAATLEIRRRELAEGRARTRIVALTANATPDQGDLYVAAGMDGLVPKPIMIDQLHDALASAASVRPHDGLASAASPRPRQGVAH